MISEKWKIQFENKTIKQLIFRYFNIRTFKISKYLWFYISSLQILTPTQLIDETGFWKKNYVILAFFKSPAVLYIA